MILPLPGEEGRGEGERNDILRSSEKMSCLEIMLADYFVRLNLPVNKWFITSVVM